MYVCLSVSFKVSVHQVWYVCIVLLDVLHQEYTSGYIQYHGERYITSILQLVGWHLETLQFHKLDQRLFRVVTSTASFIAVSEPSSQRQSKAGSLLAQTKRPETGKRPTQKRPNNEPAGPYFPHICFGHMC